MKTDFASGPDSRSTLPNRHPELAKDLAGSKGLHRSAQILQSLSLHHDDEFICRRSSIVNLIFITTITLASLARHSIADDNAAPDITDEQLKTLITALGSTDATEQSKATDHLTTLGQRARPALITAINSDNPTARQAAAPLLLALPFTRETDPAAIKTLLQTYNQSDIQAPRKITVAKILAAAQKDALPILLRLAGEDPSDDVRWVVASQIRLISSQLTPEMVQPIDRAPNQSIAALAWERKDIKRSIPRLERAIELETNDPTNDRDSILAYYDLAAHYTTLRRFEDAAEIHRRGYARNPNIHLQRGYDATDHLQALFALHANFGPLKNFEDDLQTYEKQLSRPHIQYALGKIYDKKGQHLVAQALYRAAFLATFPAWKLHTELGLQLLRLNLPDQAEQQFQAALDSTGNSDSVEAIDSRLHLAQLLADQGQDFAAAENMRSIVESPIAPNLHFESRTGNKTAKDAQALEQLEAQMHWHYLKAAKQKNNTNSIKAHLKELLRLQPEDGKIVMDVVPMLTELNREEDAKKLFEIPYQSAKSALDKNPNDPRLMNDLAWLCARSNQHLDEAQTLITAALKQDPENAGFLDTAAETNFRQGKIEQAIQQETRAIKLKPEDAFMQEQLKRFQSAKPTP